MAERRMFAKTIIDSDAFLEMPLSAQALYFHLGMRADDEGFLNNAKKIQRMANASDDDAKLLVAKKFIIPFDSGIIVIKHWKIHNYIRSDRIQETAYQDEKRLLSVKDNGSYTMSGICQTDDSQPAGKCQHRLGKDRRGEVRIGEVRIGEEREGVADRVAKIANPELQTAISNWIENRKANRSPVTTKALELGLSKLTEMYPDDIQTQIRCINESIMNNWKGFFPLKEQIKKQGHSVVDYDKRLAELNAKRGII